MNINLFAHVLDYVPATYKKSLKVPVVEFWAKHPITEELKRKRIRVAHIKDKSAQRILALKLVDEINQKLASGWNPWKEDVYGGKQFVSLKEAFDTFLSQAEKRVKKDELKEHTLRDYRSLIKNLYSWFEETFPDMELYVNLLSKSNLSKFINYKYYDQNCSPRTAKNYQGFLRTLGLWMVQSEYLPSNPADSLPKIKERKEKIRTTIPDNTLHKIFEHLKLEDYGFYMCCRMLYCCFTRRPEIVGLKVESLQLHKQLLHVPGEISKNRKTQSVTIPESLVVELSEFIKYANDDDYLFGEGLKPGKTQCAEKYISDQWAKLRKQLNLDKKYQWYSLKDTGIQNLLESGVPTIVVRDQARHYDISITDRYTNKNITKANKHLKGL